MGYSGAGGKLIHEKNQKQKISWHCPFKKKVSYSIVPVQFYNDSCGKYIAARKVQNYGTADPDRIQENGYWPNFTNKSGFLPFKKGFCTYVGTV